MYGTICDRVPDHLTLSLFVTDGSSTMKRWAYRLLVFLVLLVSFASIPDVPTGAGPAPRDGSIDTISATAAPQGHASGHAGRSADETDSSVFDHRVAGCLILVFGLAELGNALHYPLPFWTRFILPAALTVIGVLVLFVNDHGASRIGSLIAVDTFWGHDREMIEHTFYGVLSLVIAFCETLRRMGKGWQHLSAAPLVLLTLAGSLWLFVHSHADHPALEKIQFQHFLLGIVGTGAALSKGMASWLPGASSHVTTWWEVAWAGAEILFGLLLLVYSE
jgi:hypothetical protein